jgi:hypothetical protein
MIRETIEEGNEEKLHRLAKWMKESTFSDYSFMEVELISIKNRYNEIIVDGWDILDHECFKTVENSPIVSGM